MPRLRWLRRVVTTGALVLALTGIGYGTDWYGMSVVTDWYGMS